MEAVINLVGYIADKEKGQRAPPQISRIFKRSKKTSTEILEYTIQPRFKVRRTTSYSDYRKAKPKVSHVVQSGCNYNDRSGKSWGVSKIPSNSSVFINPDQDYRFLINNLCF